VGVTKGAALEAIEIAKENGLSVNILQILYASPFPVAEATAILAKANAHC